ncbi:MAG: alpha/beta hydrolase [Acidobacteriota bacterium]|nr:alpha/beta hydrolase [Acidobacteriota bacterium]
MSKYRHRSVRSLFLTAFYSALALSGYSQTTARSTTSLTYPPYNNLPTIEGYFTGADNVRLFYRVVGAGKQTIVFVHGGPGLGIEDGALDLEAVAAKGFRFIEYDQRGGARSELVSDKSKLGIDYHVRDLEALREHFRLKKLNLVGLSWGTWIVAHYASAYPQNVNRIVFLSPAPPTRELGRKRREVLASLLGKEELIEQTAACDKLPTASDAEIGDVCRKCVFFSAKLYVADPTHVSRARGDFCSYTPQAIRNGRIVNSVGFSSVRERNFQPMLSKIRTPSLVIEGAKSNVPLEGAETWAKWLPKSRLLLIPEAGHQNWLDQPEAVISAIGDFFHGRTNKYAKQLYAPVTPSK